jgi:hypothetical protein
MAKSFMCFFTEKETLHVFNSIWKSPLHALQTLLLCKTVQATPGDRLAPTINSLVSSARSQIPNSLLFSAADREHLFVFWGIDEAPQLQDKVIINLLSVLTMWQTMKKWSLCRTYSSIVCTSTSLILNSWVWDKHGLLKVSEVELEPFRLQRST